MRSLRDRYGDGPLHLIAVDRELRDRRLRASCEIASSPGPLSFAIFFAGAIVAHDLIAFPVYSLLDRDRRPGRRGTVELPGRAINYVRVPALLSGVRAASSGSR